MSDILQQLAQLAGPMMKSPQGQEMAKAIMAQMQGGGGADPRQHFAGGRPNMDGGGPLVAGAPPNAGFTPDEGASLPIPMGNKVGTANFGNGHEMDYAQSMMGRGPGSVDFGSQGDPAQMSPGVGAPGQFSRENEYEDEQGHEGMNSDGPTPEEIEMLRSKPTDQNCENFDKLFGPGAAAKVMQGGAGMSYEDHVRGAMDEKPNRGFGRKGRGEPLEGNELDDDD